MFVLNVWQKLSLIWLLKNASKVKFNVQLLRIIILRRMYVNARNIYLFLMDRNVWAVIYHIIGITIKRNVSSVLKKLHMTWKRKLALPVLKRNLFTGIKHATLALKISSIRKPAMLVLLLKISVILIINLTEKSCNVCVPTIILLTMATNVRHAIHQNIGIKIL